MICEVSPTGLVVVLGPGSWILAVGHVFSVWNRLTQRISSHDNHTAVLYLCAYRQDTESTDGW
jgi:hypothetical protein